MKLARNLFIALAFAGSSTIAFADTAPKKEPPKKEEKKEKSLYDRLGGEKAVAAVVKDFLANVVADKRINKFFAKADELKDVQVLGMFVALPGPIFSMKGPIDSVAQLKGVKTYAIPGVAAKVMEGTGAGVVAAPAVRSHEIISGGTVDAYAGYSVMDAAAFKTLQYAKHVVDIPGHLTAPAFALFINKKKWESISAKDREAIMKLSGEALSRRFAVYDELESKARADAAAAGISIKAASPAFVADLMKLAAPLEQAWLADAKAAGVDGAAALAFYKAEAQKNAK